MTDSPTPKDLVWQSTPTPPSSAFVAISVAESRRRELEDAAND